MPILWLTEFFKNHERVHWGFKGHYSEKFISLQTGSCSGSVHVIGGGRRVLSLLLPPALEYEHFKVPWGFKGHYSEKFISLQTGSCSGSVLLANSNGRLLGLSTQPVVIGQAIVLTGELPPEICNGGKLYYLVAINNLLTGVLPERYAKCVSLGHFRLGPNRLSGKIPKQSFGLPLVSMVDLSYNFFSSPIPKAIGNARNLSEFFYKVFVSLELSLLIFHNFQFY
ncbi:Leucine-rich repeat-containing protein [Artemisia annua]|uniref:Leucine-rich repeat-containing protein n=1 Tax=Artemisia annua TaxID=35608 RepID=A0A2U1NCB2_ARTAN|nr:Leucine-rich repeat-containing protein [Artemisia annua]